MSDIGLIGLAVMGANLARNIANKGFTISVYNRTTQKMHAFIEEYGSDTLIGFESIEEFINSIERPRKIILLVKAGAPVDATIAAILPYLDEEDIIVDGGNSWYKDTQRRTKELMEKGMHFVGMGVSGGEEGALHGPSLMPGGSVTAYTSLQPIIHKISAKDFSGGQCETHIGSDGAGHYIKMVHNGIEYAVMQMLAETYDILKNIYQLSYEQIQDIYKKLHQGKMSSFLTEISIEIVSKQDEIVSGQYLLESVLDIAGQKGTGRWTTLEWIERWVPIPSIAGAVFARALSEKKDTRLELSSIYSTATTEKVDGFHDVDFVRLENALYLGVLSAYAQGYDLIITAAKEEDWHVNLAEITRIWQGGCIIRADFLKHIQRSFEKSPNTTHLFLLPEIQKEFEQFGEEYGTLIAHTAIHKVPVPVFASGLEYFKSMVQARGSANFIQGLRDNFGAHTYKRVDEDGVFHSQWK